MCGIFGFSTLNENTQKLIPVLAIEMANRGRDSWGVTNGNHLFKAMGNICYTFDPAFLDWDNSNGIIFHTRAASTGSTVNLDNAHPFRFDKDLETHATHSRRQRITGIHNGCVSNHFALKQHYKDRAEFGVDSKHIFKHIIDGLDTAELDGGAVISWFDTTYTDYPDDPDASWIDGQSLYLARFKSEALYVATLGTGELVFASTEAAVKMATKLAGLTVDKVINTLPNKCYRIGQHPETKIPWLLIEGDMAWGTKTISFTPPPTNNSNFVSANDRYAMRRNYSFRNKDFGFCHICGGHVKPLVEVMCPACYTDWVNGDTSVWSQKDMTAHEEAELRGMLGYAR